LNRPLLYSLGIYLIENQYYPIFVLQSVWIFMIALSKKSYLKSKTLISRLLPGRLQFFLQRYWETILANSPFSIKLQRKIPLNPKVGIAVLAYERPEYLGLCLDSLFNTKLYDYNITFLIQDSSSKDPKVRNIIEKDRDTKYNIIRSFSSKSQKSWGGTFNKAMRKLIEIDDFDIIGSCDSDMIFHPEWLDQTIKISRWVKENFRNYIIGFFSPFNSNNSKGGEFGNFNSPFGEYCVNSSNSFKCFFLYKDDFIKLKVLENENYSSNSIIEKLNKLRVRCISTSTSYVEHIGAKSSLNKWRSESSGIINTHAINLKRGGWRNHETSYNEYPYVHTKNSFVIHVHNGGLGDHLLHSHIPRIAKEIYNFDKIYVSNFSNYRNEDYKRLIWEKNPFIDGFCDEQLVFRKSESVSGGSNLLDKIMLNYGLDDGKRWHEPELYFDPPIISEIVGKNIYDPNYISSRWELDSKLIQRYISNANIPIDYSLSLREKAIPLLHETNTYSTSSLEEFCGLIVSCAELYCLVTGTATLAASLGKSSNVFYGRNAEPGIKKYLHSQIHDYIGL